MSKSVLRHFLPVQSVSGKRCLGAFALHEKGKTKGPRWEREAPTALRDVRGQGREGPVLEQGACALSASVFSIF